MNRFLEMHKLHLNGFSSLTLSSTQSEPGSNLGQESKYFVHICMLIQYNLLGSHLKIINYFMLER